MNPMIFRAVSFCLSTGLAGLTALILTQETANLRAVSASRLGDMAIGVAAPLPLPFSNQGLAATLDVCTKALWPGYAGFFGQSQLQTTQRHCADFVTQADIYWPTNGQIGLTRATLAAGTGDIARFQAEMTRAQRYAPNQGWQAIRRVDLTLAVADTLKSSPGDLSPVLGPDLSLMLTNQPGAEALVEIYRGRAMMRPEITLALQTATPHEQKRFFNLIRLKELQ